MNVEVRYRILKALEARPEMTQRELASLLGVSLGKTNYCLRALIEKGYIRARNFKNSGRKVQYIYVLTPKGVQERTRVALEFLRRKAAEFDEIREEIDRLATRAELAEPQG